GVDAVDVDLADGILTLEFDEGPKVVVNSHSAARQIWLAANLAAGHFSPDPKTGRWFDSKTGEELWDRLRAILTDRLGHPIERARKLSEGRAAHRGEKLFPGLTFSRPRRPRPREGPLEKLE